MSNVMLDVALNHEDVQQEINSFTQLESVLQLYPCNIIKMVTTSERIKTLRLYIYVVGSETSKRALQGTFVGVFVIPGFVASAICPSLSVQEDIQSCPDDECVREIESNIPNTPLVSYQNLTFWSGLTCGALGAIGGFVKGNYNYFFKAKPIQDVV